MALLAGVSPMLPKDPLKSETVRRGVGQRLFHQSHAVEAGEFEVNGCSYQCRISLPDKNAIIEPKKY